MLRWKNLIIPKTAEDAAMEEAKFNTITYANATASQVAASLQI